jgi:hypothetical protein
MRMVSHQYMAIILVRQGASEYLSIVPGKDIAVIIAAERSNQIPRWPGSTHG